MLKRAIALVLCFSFLMILPSVMPNVYINAEENSQEGVQEAAGNNSRAAIDYSGPYVKVGEVTLPLAEHMPGTFFSRNGKACTCHYSTDCVANGSGCNCMRYYPTGNKETCEVDLLGVQCFAFARLVFYKCFGFVDTSANSSLFYNVGSLTRSQISEANVKKLMMRAAPGAHVRLARGHSVSILSMDDDFLFIYHGNAGGDGVPTESCVVSTRRYTWAEFAEYASAGILYINMPYNHPDSSVVLTEKTTGHYRITSDNGLRHRAEPNTTSESYAVIPYNTIIEVTEIDGFWGKTVYEGKTGWVFLEYTVYFSTLNISPSGTVFSLGDDKYLRGTAWRMDFDTFIEHFNKQSLTITDASDKPIPSGDFIGTGAKVALIVDGKTIDSATVCLAGDVNCNGVLDVGDYIVTRRAYFGEFPLNAVQKIAADVNGNGEIDINDYILIRRYFFNPNSNLFKDFKN